MIAVIPNIPVIMSSVNALNSPVERQRLSTRQEVLQEKYLKCKDIGTSKVKGEKKFY